MEIIVFIYLIFFALLAYWKIDWSVLLILLLLPSYLIRFEVMGLPLNLLGAMVLVSFFVWFVFHTKFLRFLKGGYKIGDFKKNREKRLKYPFGLELILLLIVALIAVAVAGFKPEALGSWRAYFFEPALFFILVLNLFQSAEQRKKIIWALACLCLVLSIYAIIQKFTGVGISNEFWRDEATRRVTSVFPYPNALALLLAPLMMIFSGYLISLMRRIKDFGRRGVFLPEVFFLVLTISLSFLAVYFTGSKGALIALALSSLFFLWLTEGWWRWLAYTSLLIFISFLIFSPGPREVVVEAFALKDFSGEVRKKQWRETWEMLTDNNLVLGSGLHNYQEAIAPYHVPGMFFNRDRDPDFRRKLLLFDEEYKKQYWQPVEIYLYPHNIFLNFWTELGLAGLLLFIWIKAKFFLQGLRVLRKESGQEKYLVIGLITAMTVIIINGLVDVPYFKNDLAIKFWLLVAFLSLVNLERNVKQKEKNN